MQCSSEKKKKKNHMNNTTKLMCYWLMCTELRVLALLRGNFSASFIYVVTATSMVKLGLLLHDEKNTTKGLFHGEINQIGVLRLYLIQAKCKS